MSSSGKLRLPKGARTCTRAKSCCANHDGGWYKDTNGWSKKYVKYMLNQHSKAIVYLCPPIFLFMSILFVSDSVSCASYSATLILWIFFIVQVPGLRWPIIWTPCMGFLGADVASTSLMYDLHWFGIGLSRYCWAQLVQLNPKLPIYFNLVGFLFSRFADRENNPVALGNQQGGPKFINPPVGYMTFSRNSHLDSFGSVW